ncbi:MAG: hypothetical protein EXS16_05690 [Gemmataceae bacterium]|nr:hypothetical protein [Gemmataceae bacterium]
MDLPIKFPSDTEVIREEVARFRALSPEKRRRAIVGALRLGGNIISSSPKAQFLQNSLLEKSANDRKIQEEVLTKYAT